MEEGFRELWTRLSGLAEADLVRRFPDERDALTALAEANVEEVIRAAVDRFRKRRIHLPKELKRAVEAAVVYAVSDNALLAVHRLGVQLRQTAPDQRSPDACILVPEYWVVALHRHLEALKAMWAACAPLASNVSEFSERRAHVAELIEELKAQLSKSRNSATHPNTYFVHAIDEDGLWEPMFIQGLGGIEMLEGILDGRSENAGTHFDTRFEGLRGTTILTRAHHDQSCDSLARLLAEPPGVDSQHRPD